MIHLIDKWYMCSKGHYVFDRLECAHCNGFTELPKVQGRFLGNRVALWDGINYHPMEKADVVNGWRPDNKPPSGWFLYYISFVLEGKKYWKIGISQDPYGRLYRELAPTVESLRFYRAKEEAYKEEQRLLRLYNPHKVRINVPKLKKLGNTEMFTRDVLNGSLK